MKSNEVLFTLGTPYAGWTDVARALLGPNLALPGFSRWIDEALREAPSAESRIPGGGALPTPTAARVAPLQALFAAGEGAGGCDARACWVLDLLEAAFPSAAYLIWIESPAAMLARLLVQRDDGDPRRWLDTWCAGTERLLRAAHRRPERCLLVVASEGAWRPAAVAHRVADRFGITLQVPPPLPAVAIDPVAHALADLMVRSDPVAANLLEEAIATCTPLGDDPADLRLTAKDAIAAISGLRSLRRLPSPRASAPAARAAPVAPVAPVALDAAAAAVVTSQAPAPKEPSSASANENENELLIDQIEQLQKELVEAHRQSSRKADAAKSAGPAPGHAGWSPQLSLEKLVLQGFRDKGPFREMNAVLRRVEFGSRKAPELMARLVEHHGRVGVAVFDLAGGESILDARDISGQEAGRNFRLIVPADAAHRERLVTWNASDWLLLRAIVERFYSELRSARPVRSRWVTIAGRLLQELDALPARLRYDAVLATAGEPIAGDPVVGLELQRISCAGRSAASLHLRWRLPSHRSQGIERSAIELVRGPQGHEEALLPCWPIEENGAAAPSLPLTSADERVVPAVAAAHEADRAFLLSLLCGLPRVVATLPEAALPPGWSPTDLARASEELPAKVAAQWAPPRNWRALARALAGRRAKGVR